MMYFNSDHEFFSLNFQEISPKSYLHLLLVQFWLPRKQKAEGKEENTWNKGGEDEPGFIDPDFPPSDESLGENYRQDVPKEWVRAIYLRGHQEQPVLFEDMEPANVCQGYSRSRKGMKRVIFGTCILFVSFLFL